jgi:asparagine synthase (glutamine-hydrolysing)
MFAFMLADLEEKQAFIARDQLGIKPLFFYEDAEYYIFSSEIKCLLPYTSLEPNPNAVNEYLVFRSVIGCETMFKNVLSLQQGHYIEYTHGKLREKPYFNLADTLRPDHDRSFRESCAQTEKLFRESVKIHLRSDVELGVQLSGGVDSSLITALASEMTGKKLHSFSISFDESAYDESEYQKRVSDRYNTEHHDYRMNEDIFTEHFEKTVWHYEHPLNDPNTVATFYLTENAKKYITVMLAGEGADESFMGYSRFNHDVLGAIKSRKKLYNHPVIRELIYRLWPIKKGKSLFNITRYDPSMYPLSYADPNIIDKLLHGCDGHMSFRHEATRAGRGSVLRETILQYQLCDLMQWFWRADRMGMASSMELRVPFCTVPMFNLANSIPYEQLVHKGECKAVLKKVAEKYLDKDQIYRKKIGFGTPIDTWINRDGKYLKMFRELMESDSFRKREHINYDHFKKLYDGHKNGTYKEVNSAFLWTYFNYEMWHRIFFEGSWKKFVS